ncbi:unnamed protein product, partial [Amoebophrya sp. A120]|eukprot:GSA120T00026320001.1
MKSYEDLPKGEKKRIFKKTKDLPLHDNVPHIAEVEAWMARNLVEAWELFSADE